MAGCGLWNYTKAQHILVKFSTSWSGQSCLTQTQHKPDRRSLVPRCIGPGKEARSICDLIPVENGSFRPHGCTLQSKSTAFAGISITIEGHSLISYNKVQGTRVVCIDQKVKVKVKEELVSIMQLRNHPYKKVASEYWVVFQTNSHIS